MFRGDRPPDWLIDLVAALGLALSLMLVMRAMSTY